MLGAIIGWWTTAVESRVPPFVRPTGEPYDRRCARLPRERFPNGPPGDYVRLQFVTGRTGERWG
ncbi:hypothetical protein GCM10009660_50460 [Catellatospora bangladeshensis]